ncbi:cytochrome P450 [Methylovulum psychrotolerans]|uniref:cytochrome P450 n=1 Tax=Methylovulum psychrotolerans TaxID=1704499 RepID=UPI001BFF03EC|nr:cytochrome P450 [Methylovulum psychrotolerans]MBT9099798.1 cytochrome P450 [Methylovulum psychrotolerans]
MTSIIKTISQLPGHPEPIIMEPDLNRVHEVFEDLVAQYGKMFTVQFANQPMVVVADVKTLNFILCKRPELFAPYRKNSKILAAIKADGIETADGSEWKRQREVIATAMESAYLGRYFETIKAVTEELKNRWLDYEQPLTKADLEMEIFGFSISVFTAVMFGDMADLPPEEREAIMALLFDLAEILGGRIDTLLPQMHLENFSEDQVFEERIKEIRGVIENLVAHNKTVLASSQGNDKAKNLLQVLLEIMAAEGLDIQNVKLTENILQILLASEPTTADTLLRVFHYIAAHFYVQQEVQNEADAIVGQGDSIEDIKDIKKLKSIEAVISETMRLSGVSRLVLVETKMDVLLEDVEIASGTPLVLLTAYCGLDEENFHQATTFNPQRWRGDNKGEAGLHNNKAALGFGAGSRSCPGRGLAMLVMKTVLAMIFGNFQITTVSSKSAIKGDKPETLDFTIDIRDKRQDLAA